ncbi:MAG TPA: lipocalin family protein [Gemmatimonadaceae bacterium]|nr:lipocalin family protein [Gemmatimonadaceae bacterium]
MSSGNIVRGRSPLVGARGRVLVLLGAVCGAVACNSTTDASGGVSIVGTWTLTSVGGKSLPATFNFPYTLNNVSYNTAQIYNSGTAVLNSNLSANVVFVVRDVSTQGSTTLFDQTETDSSSGTYVLNGSAFSLTLSGTGQSAVTRTGTLSGSTLSVTSIDTTTLGNNQTVVDTLAFVFTKSG